MTRGRFNQFSLDREGFVLVKHASAAAADPRIRTANMTHAMGRNGIKDAYHHEVAEFLRQLQASGLIVRTSLQAKKRTWAPPTGFVHLDFVPETAEMFRTWRVVSQPPQDNTLTICDASTVPSSDAVPFHAVVGPQGVPGSEFDARMCKYRPGHRWYYFSNMTPDEVLVFKGYDSEDPHAMNAMHTVFDNHAAGQQAVPRESVEARFFAFFE
jgi:hypothetical protein